MLTLLLFTVFAQSAALTPYPIIIDQSSSDELYDLGYDDQNQYLIWSINGSDTLTVKYAHANESFSVAHTIGVFPKSIYNGGFKFVKEPRGSDWLFFDNADFTVYHSCNLTAGCNKIYNATVTAQGNDNLYVELIDQTKGRILYTLYEAKTKLTNVFTADYTGQNTYHILSMNTSVMIGAYQPANVTAQLNTVLSGDPFTQIYLTSMDPGAPAIRLGEANKSYAFLPLTALTINNTAKLCGSETSNGTTEVACYEMNVNPKRTSICHLNKYANFFAVQHFVVGSWYTGFPSMEGGNWEIYKCNLLSGKSTNATLAAKGDGQFTTITETPFSATLRGTTSLFTIAVNGSSPNKPQGTAFLIHYDADPSKPDAGVVDSAEYTLTGTQFAYGSILSLPPDGIVDTTFAWSVYTQGLGFHLRVFDATTLKGDVIMNNEGTASLYLRTQSDSSDLIWTDQAGTVAAQNLYRSTLTVPSVTKQLATLNSSEYLTFEPVLTNNHLLVSGLTFTSREQPSKQSRHVPSITVPHPRLKQQKAEDISWIDPSSTSTEEVFSVDLNTGEVFTLQHLDHTYTSGMRYSVKSGLYVWDTSSDNNEPAVVYSVQAPFTAPANVIPRLSVAMLRFYQADFVPGCLAYFANKSPVWGEKMGWSVGFVGLSPTQGVNSTCTPQL